MTLQPISAMRMEGDVGDHEFAGGDETERNVEAPWQFFGTGLQLGADPVEADMGQFVHTDPAAWEPSGYCREVRSDS